MNGQGVLLVQCTARESGGVRCEAWLTKSGEKHAHFVTEQTIQRDLR